MLSLDTETTGLDLYHGARPYFVTICYEDGRQMWWEWDVNPVTRQPEVPDADVEDIRSVLTEELADGEFVFHNAKFDIAVLRTVGIEWLDEWWQRTHDTLLAGHLLASNQPHDLTSMVLHYLGEDIQPYDDRLEKACKETRRLVQQSKLRLKRVTESSGKRAPRSLAKAAGNTSPTVFGLDVLEPNEPLARYRIANENEPDMPSAGEKSWKYDGWLPKAMAEELGHPRPNEDCEHRWQGDTCVVCGGHIWWVVLRYYANADSEHTVALWKSLDQLLTTQDLRLIYEEKRKNLPAVCDMQNCGVTVLRSSLVSLRSEYCAQSEKLEASCQQIARGLYDLELPRGSANNGSLHRFVFDVLKLPVVARTKTGRPSFDKNVIEDYKRTLTGTSLVFVKSFSRRRKRGKSLEFLDAYEKYGLSEEGDVLVLHASLNPAATDTTRFSCNGPNLQQCSKQESTCENCEGEGCEVCGGTGQDLHSVRRVFGPGPGREWWTMDAENIELRIPAYVSGQPELIELFERPDEPPYYGSQHLLNFSVVYPEVWAKALPRQLESKSYVKDTYGADYYQWCKNGDFAIQYQCGEETADRTFRRSGAYRALKSKFTLLDALNRRYVEFAEKYGYVETLPDRTVNSRRGYPLLCTRSEWGRIVPTLPLNYMVQGTAGWWMVKAINRCHAQLKEWQRDGFTGRMILTVHDELVFDFPAGGKRNLPKVRRLRRLMEQGGEDVGVPTPVSVGYHPKNWAEKVKL